MTPSLNQVFERFGLPAPAPRRSVAVTVAPKATAPRWTDTGIVPMIVPPPAPPAPGSDCLKWRRAIARGEPLLKRRWGKAGGPSFARHLHPLLTRHRWERTEDGVPGHWVHDVPDPARGICRTGPLRVRCPSCERPIRLSRWWQHGCEKALCEFGEAFGDWKKLTEGAPAPVYDEA